jgi:hypothetical protein
MSSCGEGKNSFPIAVIPATGHSRLKLRQLYQYPINNKERIAL